MSNRLKDETSPYLLQHKDNPVDWYPWCQEAFEKAKKEDKPVFLSIGYSACHWCHVFAHESFEDSEIADILNAHFISVKVDKEERPDIDSVYMSVCQAFTGSGGWPTSIFLTAEQEPFFAGTYFPKSTRGGMIGFRELLLIIHEKWTNEREVLLAQSDKVIRQLKRDDVTHGYADESLVHSAYKDYARIYDKKHGGFGRAPKFPTPHNLLFLLCYHERYNSPEALGMAEHTLVSMYRGGIFDHVGYGFCRYSTDNGFLVPHFEKMLYDNALLALSYCKAYTVTKKILYLNVAKKTADYILREMTSPQGAFFTSQDADSDGREGAYYLFTPDEVISVLGKENAQRFNRQYDITDTGNFDGSNILNLKKSDCTDNSCEQYLPALYDYRKARYSLHRDEKIITSFNSLMIAALSYLYLVSRDKKYLRAAQNASDFIQKHLCDEDTLYVSYHSEQRGVKGFLDDYAAYIFALLSLYRATLTQEHLTRAKHLCNKVLECFSDNTGGFYMYTKEHEQLLLRPKETYDGATPSGNSLICYDLVRLSLLTQDEKYKLAAERQLDYMFSCACSYPTNHAMYLIALAEYERPPVKITVCTAKSDDADTLPLLFDPDTAILLLTEPTQQYPLKNGKATYYVCRGHTCLPPTNDLNETAKKLKY